MMKMPSQFNSKNTIPLETLKERIRNRKVDFSYMNIATIVVLGTLFLGLFGLLITAISRCVAKRKTPKGGRSFELNQDLVPKERTSKSIFKKPSAPTNFEQTELSSPSTSFQVKGN